MMRKQARIKQDADGQRRQLTAMHEREKGIIDSILGTCDNCRKKARVIIQKTGDGHLLRMCYHHADMHWQHRAAHTSPRTPSTEPVRTTSSSPEQES